MLRLSDLSHDSFAPCAALPDKPLYLTILMVTLLLEKRLNCSPLSYNHRPGKNRKVGIVTIKCVAENMFFCYTEQGY